MANRRVGLAVAASLLLSGMILTNMFKPLGERMRDPSSDENDVDELSFVQKGITLRHDNELLPADPKASQEVAVSGAGTQFLSSKVDAALRRAPEFLRDFLPFKMPFSTVEGQKPEATATAPISSAGSMWFRWQGTIVYIIFACCVAFLYTTPCLKPDKIDDALIEDQQSVHGFNFWLFDSTKCSMYLVFCACCCPFVRWPATVSNEKLRLIGFWPAVILFAFLSSRMFGGVLFVGLLVAQIYFRQQIRMKYNVENGTCMTCFEDCLAWTFCYPCAIAQEARQVEFVRCREADA